MPRTRGAPAASPAGRPGTPQAPGAPGSSPPWPRTLAWLTKLRWVAIALLLPLGLFLPGILRGERFVSVLPVSVEPLRSERPEDARAADEGAQWVTGDRLFPFLTDQTAARAELQAGHLPLWEPALGLGLPLYAGTLVALLYPPNWLALVLPPDRAAGPLAAVSLALAGLGLGLLLRRLGLRPLAVACGVIAIELGGFGLSNLPYFMKVDAALWIPWSLWAIEGLFAEKRWSGLWLTASLCLSFLAGFVPIAVFGLALCGVWALVRARARRRDERADGRSTMQIGHVGHPGHAGRAGLLVCAAFAVLGVLGAAVQLVPTFETSRESARTSGGELLPQSLPGAVLWGLCVPDLFGGPRDTTPANGSPVAWWLTDPDEYAKAEAVNALEWNTYALAGAVLLALVAVVATPRRAAFPALALVCVLGFALGRRPASWLYALPGLDLGAPGRVLALAWILWPWLAALGVEALLARAPRALVTFFAAAAVLATASFVLWIGLEPERWVANLEGVLLERYGEAFDQTLETIRARIPMDRALAAAEALRRSLSHTLGAALAACAAGLGVVLFTRPARRDSALAPALGALLVLGCAALPPLASGATAPGAVLALAVCAGLFAVLLPRGEARSSLPLVVLLCAEGWLAAGARVRGCAPSAGELFPPSPAIEAIARAAGDGRVLRYDASPSGLDEVQRLARPNLLSAYGISDLTPYLVFTPRRLVELVGALDPAMLSRRHVSHLADTARLDHPILDLLRVTAVLSLHPLEHPRLVPELEREGFCVYRRKGALPAVRIVRDARVPASDEEGLALLASGTLDLARTMLLAPEDAGAARDLSVPTADWKPGDVERVERPARGRLDVAVWGSSGGWLVMHEQYAPGWRARVNGKEVPLVRADHALRAVRIPRGESLVETWYAPPSLRAGLTISAAAWLGALALASVRHRFRRGAPALD